jgi:hypothetical protein
MICESVDMAITYLEAVLLHTSGDEASKRAALMAVIEYLENMEERACMN